VQKTWVVVADRSRARIFTVATPKGPLTELEDLVHPEARAHEGDLTSDRLGRSSHNVMGKEHVARDQQAHEFAREIANRLEHGRIGAEFEKLLIVAAPDLLGMLRKAMNANVAKTIVQEIDKNVAQQSPADIRKLLPKFLL
jgi:protein required for attachment to host cells